jgi:hypothetical protein
MTNKFIKRILALVSFAGISIGWSILACPLTADYEASRWITFYSGTDDVPVATYLSFFHSPHEENICSSYYLSEAAHYKIYGDLSTARDLEPLGDRERESSIAFSPVPEPSTILLLGTGLIALAGITRRRAKKNHNCCGCEHISCAIKNKRL